MRRLITVAAAAMLLLATLGVGSASASCGGGPSYVILSENTNGGGDSVCINFTTSNVNLDNVVHTQSGICATVIPLKTDDDWEDCVSSVFVHLNAFTCFVAWQNGVGSTRVTYSNGTSWINDGDAADSHVINVATSSNDTMSWFAFGSSSGGGCVY